MKEEFRPKSGDSAAELTRKAAMAALDHYMGFYGKGLQNFFPNEDLKDMRYIGGLVYKASTPDDSGRPDVEAVRAASSELAILVEKNIQEGEERVRIQARINDLAVEANTELNLFCIQHADMFGVKLGQKSIGGLTEALASGNRAMRRAARRSKRG